MHTIKGISEKNKKIFFWSHLMKINMIFDILWSIIVDFNETVYVFEKTSGVS